MREECKEAMVLMLTMVNSELAMQKNFEKMTELQMKKGILSKENKELSEAQLDAMNKFDELSPQLTDEEKEEIGHLENVLRGRNKSNFS